MGMGSAMFIWAGIALYAGFPLLVVGAYVLLVRPDVDRRWLFALAGAGVVLGARSVLAAVAGVILLRVPAAREHAVAALAAEHAAVVLVAVPALGALAGAFRRRRGVPSPPSASAGRPTAPGARER
jgi:hypothetical protein